MVEAQLKSAAGLAYCIFRRTTQVRNAENSEEVQKVSLA